jgi:hypothetical protein
VGAKRPERVLVGTQPAEVQAVPVDARGRASLRTSRPTGRATPIRRVCSRWALPPCGRARRRATFRRASTSSINAHRPDPGCGRRSDRGPARHPAPRSAAPLLARRAHLPALGVRRSRARRRPVITGTGMRVGASSTYSASLQNGWRSSITGSTIGSSRRRPHSGDDEIALAPRFSRVSRQPVAAQEPRAAGRGAGRGRRPGAAARAHGQDNGRLGACGSVLRSWASEPGFIIWAT